MSILDIAEEQLEREGGGSVSAVYLRIGELSGVVPEALRSAFEMARAGTALEGARLVIEDVPVMVYCEPCREQRPIASLQRFQCAVCGAPSGRVVAGNELEVRAMEIAS